jgi:hypothetical protein
MPTPVNTPAPTVATNVTTGGATEVTVVTSAPANILIPQATVLLEADVDFLNSASGVTITFKFRRGTGTGGTLVSFANTWGPFTLAASTRYNFGVSAVDFPGESASLAYTLTATIASNAATSTFETAIIAMQVQGAS